MRADVFVAVFGLACVALGLTAGRAWPTARAVERWLDDAEEMAQAAVRDLPAADVAVDEDADGGAGLAVGPQDLQPAAPVACWCAETSTRNCPVHGQGEYRLPSAVERAAMYDTLTNDPPGPDPSVATAPACRPAEFTLRAGGHQREGRGRADRRDWHKHRGPYAPDLERHVTLAQAETEAHALVWRMRDRAREQESAAFWGELADLRDAARAHLAAWPDWQAA